MAYIALYRKWRPNTFDEVKGQDAVVTTLKNQIQSDRVGHAYLFCGSRGTGKTSVAKIFAKAVNCENRKDGSPCGECALCRAAQEGNSLNVIEIDAASNNGVDNIRQIREEVQYRPAQGRYRVYIIDEVHMLSAGAFNALLKTLEEPPAYVIFILATTEPHKIPLTVLSRCQRYDFHRITVEDICERLRELAAAESVRIEEKALTYLARKADGALRDAISLLDQCLTAVEDRVITYESALKALGTVDSEVLSRMLRALIDGNTTAALSVVEEIRMAGRDLGQFVQDIVWYLRNLLLLMTADATEDLLEMSEEDVRRLAEEGERVRPEELMRYIRLFSALFNEMRTASDKRVLLELCVIKATRPAMETDLEAYESRLALLERSVRALEEGGLRMSAALPNGAAAGSVPAGAPGDTFAFPGQSGPVSGSAYSAAGSAGTADPASQSPVVKLSPAQWEDLQDITQKWPSLLRSLPYENALSLRGVWLEPRDGGVMGLVFPDQFHYNIANRLRTLPQLGEQLASQYGKEVRFDSRVRKDKEGRPQFISEEELAGIHMTIEMED